MRQSERDLTWPDGIFGSRMVLLANADASAVLVTATSEWKETSMLSKALVRAAARPLAGPCSGMWQVVRSWVEGRQARLFERERRTTLQTVPTAVPQGAWIIDQRADGSSLELRIPPRGSHPDVHEGRPQPGSAGVLLP
jgi:hypothetical protein